MFQIVGQNAAIDPQLADNLGQLLHDHPELAQHLINGGGGLLESLVPGIGLLDPGDGPIHQATTNDAARLLALLLGDSTDYSVTGVDDVAGGASTAQPDSLRALMQQLDATNGLDDDPSEADMHGAIQIQQVSRTTRNTPTADRIEIEANGPTLS